MYMERSRGCSTKRVLWDGTKCSSEHSPNVKANGHKQTNMNRIIQGAHRQQKGGQDIWGGVEGEGHIKHNVTMTMNKAPLYPPPTL